MDRMKDKIVVVTGAAHGIGAAISQRFAEEGAVLALIDLDPAALARTASQLPEAKPLTIVADVTDETAVDDAFARIADAYTRIDVLINNVGGSRNQKLWEMTEPITGISPSGSTYARLFYARVPRLGR